MAQMQHRAEVWKAGLGNLTCLDLTRCCGCRTVGTLDSLVPCSLCHKEGLLIPSVFCSQECLNTSWRAHHRDWHEERKEEREEREDQQVATEDPGEMSTAIYPQGESSSDQADVRYVRCQQKATVLLNEHNYRRAMKALKKCIRMGPNDHLHYVRASTCFLNSGYPDKAVEVALRAVDIASYNAFFEGRLGSDYLRAVFHAQLCLVDYPNTREMLPQWYLNKGLLQVVWRSLFGLLGNLDDSDTIELVHKSLALYCHVLMEEPGNEYNLHTFDRIVGTVHDNIHKMKHLVAQGVMPSHPRYRECFGASLAAIGQIESSKLPRTDFISEESGFGIAAVVELRGLAAKPQWNGRFGLICQVQDGPTGRWAVKIDNEYNLELIQQENLRSLGFNPVERVCFAMADEETRNAMLYWRQQNPPTMANRL